MSATQIRVRSSVAGSGQDRLDDWMQAVNAFMGIAGNAWDNQPGTPPGVGWDQSVAFNGNLVGVAGSDMVAILQEIDNLTLGGGGPDTNFATNNLTSSGNRSHDFQGLHSLEIMNTTSLMLESSGLTTIQGTATKIISSLSSAGGAIQFFGGSGFNNNYVSLKAPNNTGATQGYTLPNAVPAANGYLLSSTTAGVWSWVDPVSLDSNFTTASLTRAASAGALTHQFNNNNLTITGTGTHTYSSSIMNVTGSTSVAITGNLATQIKSDSTQLKGNAASTAGNLAFYESTNGGGTDFIKFQAPGTMAASYTATLPGTTPSANGKTLKVLSGGGTASVTLEWGDDTDTHFANTDLTATGTRLHTWGANGLTITGTGAHTYKGGTMVVEGTSGMNLQSDVSVIVKGVGSTVKGLLKIAEQGQNGTNNIGITVPDDIASNYTMTLPGTTPAANGKILKVLSGGGTALPVLEWGDETGAATDTSITSGTLLIASGPRTADFGGQTLSLTNATTIDLSGSSTITSTGSSLDVRNATSSLAGVLRIFEDADAANDNFVAFKAPTALSGDTTYTLPAAYPGGNDYMLVSDVTGTLQWVAQPSGGTDSSITEGTLGVATGARVANFNTNSLTFQNLTTFSATSSGNMTFANTGLILNHVTASTGGKLLFNDGTDTRTVSLQAPAAASATYTFTFPADLPGSTLAITSDVTGQLAYAAIPAAAVYERAYITLDVDYTGGTQINLDGSSANQTLQSGDTIVMTGITSQADLANSKKISFWVDGIKADVAGTPGSHCTATYVSSTAISLTQNLPAGTVVEIERIS